MNLTLKCPLCATSMYGGMTLVRHLHDTHNIPHNRANKLVDELYDKEQKMSSPYQMEVTYQHLTADECEKLKEKVKDKETEYSWGTYGPKHDEALQHYNLTHLSTQHLENLLITQPQITNELAAAILMLLKKRYGAV